MQNDGCERGALLKALWLVYGQLCRKMVQKIPAEFPRGALLYCLFLLARLCVIGLCVAWMVNASGDRLMVFLWLVNARTTKWQPYRWQVFSVKTRIITKLKAEIAYFSRKLVLFNVGDQIPLNVNSDLSTNSTMLVNKTYLIVDIWIKLYNFL